jgi:hypothetical protein
LIARLRQLAQELRTPERPARYVGLALAADLPVSFALLAAISLLPGPQNPTFPGVELARIAFVMVGFVPLLETVCLAVVLEALRRLPLGDLPVALVAAVAAAALHSWAQPLWGPVVAWTFFLQAWCYLTWRRRSWLTAFGLTATLHALHNLAAVGVLAAQRALTSA